jgi:SHS2 domain-containing protein
MAATSRTLQHVGEWKVELRAAAIEELFVELARILADAAGPRRPTDTPRAWERVELESDDHATLLVDWANELIGRSEVAGRAYGGVRNLVIESAPDRAVHLSADVRGDPVDEWVSPVKAATYHDAIVAREESEWHAVVLLDV